MKNNLFVLSLLLCYVVLKSNACGTGRGASSSCDTRKQDTVLFINTITANKPVYKIGDTILIESIISDSIKPLSGAATFTKSLNQLYLYLQPYSVVTSSSLPNLQFANNEFNPVVISGQLQNSSYGGYSYLYKRVDDINTLKVGFIAGRAGLYIIESSVDQYNYGGNSTFTFYPVNDYCTSYAGISNVNSSQQNKNYWDTLGVTVVNFQPNYGNKFIEKSMRNYFFFKVVP